MQASPVHTVSIKSFSVSGSHRVDVAAQHLHLRWGDDAVLFRRNVHKCVRGLSSRGHALLMLELNSTLVQTLLARIGMLLLREWSTASQQVLLPWRSRPMVDMVAKEQAFHANAKRRGEVLVLGKRCSPGTRR